MKKLKINFLFYLFILIFGISNAKAQAVDYSVYANIIYRFTKYIEWPDQKSGEFVIGVIGESSLDEELQKLTAGKTAGGRPIKIVSYAGNESSFPCSILFVIADESSQLKYVLAITKDNPVFIITDKKGFSLKGACINFSMANGHLELEMNKKNIEQRHIKVATELVGLCKVVEK
jgi:hypothetical protein